MSKEVKVVSVGFVALLDNGENVVVPFIWTGESSGGTYEYASMLAKSINGNRLIGKIGVHKDFANKALWNDDGTPKAPVVKSGKAGKASKTDRTIADLTDSELGLLVRAHLAKKK